MFLWTDISHLNYLPDIFPYNLCVQTQSSDILDKQLSLYPLSPSHGEVLITFLHQPSISLSLILHNTV